MRISYKVCACILNLFMVLALKADPVTYILSPKSGTLGTGEEIQLQLRKVFAGNPQSQQISAAEQRNFQWTLNTVGAGVETPWGTLTPGLIPGICMYKAPSTIPARNPVAISVSFRDASGQKIILVSNIRITACKNSFEEDDQDVICFDKPGNYAGAATPLSSAGIYYAGKAVTMISVQGMDKEMKVYSLTLSFAGKGPGTYHWDFKACACKVSAEVNANPKNISSIAIGPPGVEPVQYAIVSCTNCEDEDRCTILPMSGVINIHEYGPPGGKIKGAVVGQFIKNPPKGDAVEVVFRFEVPRYPDIQ